MTIYRILYIYTDSECSSIHSAQAHSNSMAAGCPVTLSPPLRDFAPFSSRVLLCNSLVFDVLVEGIAERFPLGVAVVLRLEHLASKDYRLLRDHPVDPLLLSRLSLPVEHQYCISSRHLQPP